MEWSELRDPAGEFDMKAAWTLVSRDYVSEEIQQLIDEQGVREMVSIVNAHFRSAYAGNALVLARGDRRKVIDDAPER
jgi:hypothetical protein